MVGEETIRQRDNCYGECAAPVGVLPMRATITRPYRFPVAQVAHFWTERAMDDDFTPHRLVRDTITGEVRCCHCGDILVAAPNAPVPSWTWPNHIWYALIRLATEPCSFPEGDHSANSEPLEPVTGPLAPSIWDKGLPVYRAVVRGTFEVIRSDDTDD
jgi:hypothetical protein